MSYASIENYNGEPFMPMWHKKETVQPLTGLHRTLHRNYFLMGRAQYGSCFLILSFLSKFKYAESL